MGLAVVFEFLADALNGHECLALWRLARICGGAAQTSFDHGDAIGDLLGRGRGLDRIGFFKAHHLDQKITIAGREAKVQRRLAFARDLVPGRDASLVQAARPARGQKSTGLRR